MSAPTDAELVADVRKWYGQGLARKVAEMFRDDDGSSAFVESVRRSLTCDYERHARLSQGLSAGD